MENADGSNSSLSATTPSAPEGPGLSSSDLVVIEVLAAVTLFLVLVLLPISVVILLIVRKKRRLSRDGNGRRVTRMVPSERFPASQMTRAPTQMQNSTNSTTADDHVPRPNVSVDNSKAKFIESFYTFELEVEDDAYDDVIYPCSLDRSEDVVDISLFYERIRTVSKTYGYYEDIGCHTPSLYYYEESLLSNSYEDLSSAMGDSDEDSYDDIVVDVHYVEPPSKENVLMEQIQQMDISRTIKVNDLHLAKMIGHGQFGSVHRGVWRSSLGTQPVAVKVLRNNVGSKDQLRFLKECYIMAQFDHPNIVQLLGVVTEPSDEQKYMVLELLGKGDLRLFLRNVVAKDKTTLAKNPQKVHSILLQFTRQILSGMKYLSSKGFVHRDLAARNIFISEDMVCKIGDFGLTCELSHVQDGRSSKLEKIPIPLRWAAIEVMEDTKYSSSSDVWSFGVVLFEMWSLGKKPYGDMNNHDIITYVFSGQRLSPPTGCPKPVYRAMISCWHPRPASRPSFSVLQSLFKKEDRPLLHFLPEDPSLVHPRAHILGEDLQYASNLYPSVQKSYSIPNSYTMPRP